MGTVKNGLVTYITQWPAEDKVNVIIYEHVLQQVALKYIMTTLTINFQFAYYVNDYKIATKSLKKSYWLSAF